MVESGSTLLHLCTFRGNLNILQDLLTDSALSPLAINKKGDTCLHMAISKRNIDFCYEIIRWCIEKEINCS